MKSLLLVITFFLSLQSCVSTKYKCDDKRACKEYEKRLDSLSDFLFFQKQINYNSKNHPSKFFERITKYESNADISYSGQDPPTYNDYLNWTSWYGLHYNRLRYDKKAKSTYAIGRNPWFLEGDEACLELIFFSPNNSETTVILDESIENYKEPYKNQYLVKTDIKTKKALIELLGENQVLNDAYIFGKSEGYDSLITDKTRFSDDAKLIIQADYSDPCHNDTLFILVFDINKARKVLSDLDSFFKENIGFKKLKEEL